MNRIQILLVLVSAAFLAAPLSQPLPAAEEDGCDMSTVVKGFFCKECDSTLVKGDLVSGATYYACSVCETARKESGSCPRCDEALEKKVSGKDVCPHCFAKPVEAELCEKTCFECPECYERGVAGTCPDCEKKRAKTTVRALIEYFCPQDGCSESSYGPGKCGDEECGSYGKPLVKTCTESGEYPHVKAGAKPE